MFDFILFGKALLAGFVVAVPIGAIGALCLRRALQGRWLVGLITGFGAAVADAILATAAMFGLSLLLQYLVTHQEPVRLIGGLFLIVIGAHMIRKRHPKISEEEPAANGDPRRWRRPIRGFATGFGLTIINPATIIAFAGVYAGLGLVKSRMDGLIDMWLVVVGTFVGSALWWCTLTGMAYLVRHHLSVEWIVVINVLLGLVVAGLGVASLASLLPNTPLSGLF